MRIDGTLAGNLLGVFMLLLFQACGLAVGFGLLKKEARALRLLVGSVLGTVMLQWFPALFAFFFGFTQLSHLLGLGCAVVLALVFRPKLEKKMLAMPKITPLWLLPSLTLLLFAFLVAHGFRMGADGSIYSSQCTYGDMSMHLGFITSIANQGVFPPDYSILPGTLLSYPFLSDSISSSLYIFGASLRLSYIFPMFFAGAQVMGAFLLFMRLWLGSAKRSLLSFFLFFFCGGFGFAFFLSGSVENPQNFTRIFTAFYETPTNLIGENVRWVNTIVDMLVPQRATLFGWAVLFTAFVLLYKSVYEKKRLCFVLTGVLAGALPMIHTHSFLALALVSLCWLLFDLWEKVRGTSPYRIFIVGLVLMPFAMAALQVALGNNREQSWLMLPAFSALAVVALVILGLLVILAKKKALVPELTTWGVYLLITAVLALPQLVFWTFSQAVGESFTRGYFGWANLNDHYLWFVIKNIGVPALLFIPAILWADKQKIRVLSPVLLIWLLGELVVFQPNVYDNNKLFYVAYFFVCGLIADYMAALYNRIRGIRGSRVLAISLVFFCGISALLTMGREAVASYQLYGASQIEAEAFIESATDPHDVILTNDRHNNAIAALSGRNIVCGSSSYVYYHGLSCGERYEDMKMMYETPAAAQGLFQRYKVDFILISEYERGSYAVDEAAISRMFPLVFESKDIKIFRVKEV